MEGDDAEIGERGKEGGREGGRKGGREGGREGGIVVSDISFVVTSPSRGSP